MDWHEVVMQGSGGLLGEWVANPFPKVLDMHEPGFVSLYDKKPGRTDLEKSRSLILKQ